MPLYALAVSITAAPEEVESTRPRHLEHLDELRAGGKLRFAGEFKNGDGFFWVLDVVDRHEAESISRASPWIEAGLASWLLREWVER